MSSAPLRPFRPRRRGNRIVRPVPQALVSILLAVCGADALRGQAPAPDQWVLPPAEVAAAADQGRAVLDSLLRARNLPGIQVAVLVGGRIVWSEGLGYADVETKTPVTPVSRFRVGSVSKSLTAAALAQLVEAGSVDLDAPVQAYVPGFPRKRWPISTRQMAGHLSGIRHYAGDEFLISRRYGSVLEALEIFAADSLVFEPGTRYGYSSYAWNLISAVIEAAAGRPFLDHMGEAVFRKLDLSHTGPDWTDSLVAYRTSYYVQNQAGKLLNAPYVDNSYKWAGGGFLSTAEDLVRFADAHSRPGFLRRETLDLLFTSQRTVNGESTDYGIGWRTALDQSGRRIVGHGGGSIGGSTMLIMYPDERVAVATIVNMSGAPVGEALTARIAEPYLAALARVRGAGSR